MIFWFFVQGFVTGVEGVEDFATAAIVARSPRVAKRPAADTGGTPKKVREANVDDNAKA